MVQKIESEGTAERVAGLKGPDRSQPPTAAAPEFPSNLHDRKMGMFRRSFWKRLVQLAVCNDDGSRIIGNLEAKVDDVLAEMKLLNEQIKTLLEME